MRREVVVTAVKVLANSIHARLAAELCIARHYATRLGQLDNLDIGVFDQALAQDVHFEVVEQSLVINDEHQVRSKGLNAVQQQLVAQCLDPATRVDDQP